MSKKTVKKEEIRHYCRECKHSYDYHELDYKGEPFLCKCPFFQYSKFLNRDCCSKFEKKR